MIRALLLGIAASFFFAFTFILNHQMHNAGGSWLFSASLRYFFMFPILLIVLVIKKEYADVLRAIAKQPIQWVTWSTIGFGLFYAPLSFASVYAPSWLVAGTWQITIVCGALLSPLFFYEVHTPNGSYKIRNKIPKQSLLMSCIILMGIFLIQLEQASHIATSKILLGMFPVLLAAFSYPLGNRKMMALCGGTLNTLQRVFGMTLCSMPFWGILFSTGLLTHGFPSKTQLIQSLVVAIFSGVIATVLFFKATDLISSDPHKLAVIESTQAGEVIFTLLGGIVVFHDQVPTPTGLTGVIFIVIGMILNSLITK